RSDPARSSAVSPYAQARTRAAAPQWMTHPPAHKPGGCGVSVLLGRAAHGGFGGPRFLGTDAGVRALLARFLERGLAVAGQAIVRGRLEAGLLGGARHERIELALRAQTQRHRVLGLDVGDVPVRTVADRLDGGARGADQLADGAV